MIKGVQRELLGREVREDSRVCGALKLVLRVGGSYRVEILYGSLSIAEQSKFVWNSHLKLG